MFSVKSASPDSTVNAPVSSMFLYSFTDAVKELKKLQHEVAFLSTRMSTMIGNQALIIDRLQQPTRQQPQQQHEQVLIKGGAWMRDINELMGEIGGINKLVVSKEVYLKKWAQAATPAKLVLSLLDVCINRTILATSLFWGGPGRLNLHGMNAMQALLQQTEIVFPGCRTAAFLRSIAQKVNDKCRQIRNTGKSS